MKKQLALILALVMLLSLCACGASGGSASDSIASAPSYNSAAQDMAEMPMPEPEIVHTISEEADYGGLSAAGGVNGTAEEGAPTVDPEKIIYSADVTLETTAFDEAVEGIASLMEECGGWIESSSVNDANYYSRARGYASSRSAYYTLRVPSARFAQLMNRLSTLGNVPYTHTYSENVTAQYYDVQARLTAYTAQETRLLEMMEVAETVSDVIAIEEKLTELRYQIESLQSVLNNYDRRVSYSSIYLSVEEVQEYTPETVVELSYAQELGLAVSRGFRNAGRFFKNLLIDLAASIPTLIFLAVVIAVAVPVAKKRRGQAKAKKAEKNNADNNKA